MNDQPAILRCGLPLHEKGAWDIFRGDASIELRFSCPECGRIFTRGALAYGTGALLDVLRPNEETLLEPVPCVCGWSGEAALVGARAAMELGAAKDRDWERANVYGGRHPLDERDGG